LVFPIPAFTFGEHVEGFLHPIGTGFRAFGFGDPFQVFLFMTVAEVFEGFQGFRICPKGIFEPVRDLEILLIGGFRL
jgi:hypothetical protein